MANYCDYSLMVVGVKSNVQDFINIITADYDYNTGEFNHKDKLHFYRVFDAQVMDEDYNRNIPNGLYGYAIISGYCAWSVQCCMLPGFGTYYNDFESGNRIGVAKNYGTHLLKESKRLHLLIEVFSIEPGMGFQEHYKIINGVLVTDDCRDYEEYWLGEVVDGSETFEEWVKDYAINPEKAKEIQEQWDYQSSSYIPNEVPWDFSIDSYNNPINIIPINMLKPIK